MPHLTRYCALLAATFFCLSLGAGSTLANKASDTTLVRIDAIRFVDGTLNSSSPQSVVATCKLFSPKELKKLGEKKGCEFLFFFAGAIINSLEKNDPAAQAYVTKCYVASNAATLIAPVLIHGNSARITIHPQGIPPKFVQTTKNGTQSIACGGGTIFFTRAGKGWLMSSFPNSV